jgi:4-hydroxybenzoate polyprenyltransferase
MRLARETADSTIIYSGSHRSTMGAEGASIAERFVRGVDRLRDILEKERMPLATAFLFVIVLATVRDISEYYLLDPDFVSTAHPWIYSMAHHVAFYVVVYLGLVLLLAAFSGRGLRRSLAFITAIYAIIVLPPFLDYFVFGVRESYSYFDWTEFINAILHFSGAKFHPGQGFEVLFVLVGMGSYIFWSQREKLDQQPDRSFALMRLAFYIIFALSGMFFVATPQAYLPVGFINGVAEFPNWLSTRYNLYHIYLLAYYVAVAFLITFILGLTVLKKEMKTVFRGMRPFQTLFFAGIVLAGMAMGWTYSGGYELVSHILDRPYWANLGLLGVSLFASLSLWQATTIWNDLSDLKMDRPAPRRTLLTGVIPLPFARQISYCLAITGMTLAFLLSFALGAMAAAILLLGWAYSYPPLRLKEHLLRPLIMGLGTFLAFLFGYLTPFGVIDYVSWNHTGAFLTGEMMSASLSMTAIEVGLCMLFGLLVGSMVTDVDGYAEDLAGGVKTVYTMRGMDQGTTIVAVLIFLASLLPLILFQDFIDLLFFPVIGAAAAYIFWRLRSSRATMVVALVGLIFAAYRLIMIL